MLRTRSLAVILLGTIVALQGCERPTPPPSPDEAPDFQAPDLPTGSMGLNVGDVEAQIWAEGTLAVDAPGVEVNEIVDQRDRLNMVTIDVFPPYPNELHLRYEMHCVQDFPHEPAVSRITILRNGEPVGSLAGLFAADGVQQNYETTVDVMEGLDEIPETMEVIVQGESILMPRGTDPAEIDPETAESSPERMSEYVYCNPIRIRFHPEEEEEQEDVEAEPEADEAPPAEDDDAEPEEDGDTGGADEAQADDDGDADDGENANGA